MAPATSNPIETLHEDMIHDAQLDYYGKRLATCSSDRTIKIFDVSASPGNPGATGSVATGGKGTGVTLTGHTGPVWQVAWAHPKYGSVLASCSYDGKVLIWRETPPNSASSRGPGHGGVPGAAGAGGGWSTIKEHSLHTASVNSISWAPHELGAIVACASSDGRVSVLTFKNDGTWDASLFMAHSIGCTAVSWSPAVLPGSLISPAPLPTAGPNPPAPSNKQPGSNPLTQPSPAGTQPTVIKRFASGGCDNLVKIWGYRDDTNSWVEEESLEGHTDWVRDVAWAPNIGLPRSYIASASQDKTVIIWTKDSPGAPWTKTPLLGPTDPTASTSVPGATGAGGSAEPGRFAEVVWRVSWSLAGNILAVSCADGKVTLWKESLSGSWECVSEMTS